MTQTSANVQTPEVSSNHSLAAFDFAFNGTLDPAQVQEIAKSLQHRIKTIIGVSTRISVLEVDGIGSVPFYNIVEFGSGTRTA